MTVIDETTDEAPAEASMRGTPATPRAEISQACRETALGRITRVLEHRKRELQEIQALHDFLDEAAKNEIRLSPFADELLWRLLREVDRR